MNENAINLTLTAIASGAFGWLAQNIWTLLSFRRQQKRDELALKSEKNKQVLEEIAMGKEMMKAIAELRQDVLNAYEKIEEVEAENRQLIHENRKLKDEKDQMEAKLTEARHQLDLAKEQIETLHKQLTEYLKLRNDKLQADTIENK